MATLDDFIPKPVQETHRLPSSGTDLNDRMAAAGFRRIKRIDLKTVCIDLHVSDRHPAVSIFTWETAQGIDKALAYVRINGETSILPVMGECRCRRTSICSWGSHGCASTPRPRG